MASCETRGRKSHDPVAITAEADKERRLRHAIALHIEDGELVLPLHAFKERFGVRSAKVMRIAREICPGVTYDTGREAYGGPAYHYGLDIKIGD